MPSQKRSLQDITAHHKSKKPKISEDVEAPGKPLQTVVSGEVDFPRGGGTSFTPLEVKTIRAEGVKEANEELFDVIVLIQKYSTLET
jgi:rRNA biogenesis protein RRP5